MDIDLLLERMSSQRILVVGDVILDRFVFGLVERVSPEAPVPVLKHQKSVDVLGGAGNVARNLCALGANVDLVAAVGDDEAASELGALAAAYPKLKMHPIVQKDRPTTVKMRLSADRHNLLRVDYEEAKPLSASGQEYMTRIVESLLPAADLVLLSDYAKGALPKSLLLSLIPQIKKRKIRIVVDPKVVDFSCYRGATVLTPNSHEAMRATGFDCHIDDEAQKAGERLLELTSAEAVVITRGAQGITLVERVEGSQETVSHHLKSKAREVFDVSGAGDTFVAALALGLLCSDNVFHAAMVSNLAAGIVVAKAGTAVVEREELRHALLQALGDTMDLVIHDQTEAKEQIDEWKMQGYRVAFTNGCFDLLHPGHVRLLQQAKLKCDKLVVAINTDVSVKRLKGEKRPLQNERARAEILAALKPVDLVVFFGEDTPLELINFIRPDALVKGADYTESEVVGAKEVRSWGGEVVLVPLVEGHSTTSIVDTANKSTPKD